MLMNCLKNDCSFYRYPFKYLPGKPIGLTANPAGSQVDKPLLLSEGKQKSSPDKIRWAFNMLKENILKLLIWLICPPAGGWNWHLFHVLWEYKAWQVVKASSGHYPLPFLISVLKNWYKDKGLYFKFPNQYSKKVAKRYLVLSRKAS